MKQNKAQKLILKYKVNWSLVARMSEIYIREMRASSVNGVGNTGYPNSKE
jgi:hypothetical protein